MDTTRLRRTLVLNAVLFCVCMAGAQKTFNNPGIRGVDILVLVAMGMLLGVFLVNLRLYFLFKNKK
jgi:hypothetical protein